MPVTETIPAAETLLAVVLYACLPLTDRANPGRLLGRLEQYATAHGWQVHGEYVDRKPLPLLTMPRPAWVRVVEEIEAGRARGIVAPTEAMCAYYPWEREEFRAWLASRKAFASYAPRSLLIPDPLIADPRPTLTPHRVSRLVPGRRRGGSGSR